MSMTNKLTQVASLTLAATAMLVVPACESQPDDEMITGVEEVERGLMFSNGLELFIIGVGTLVAVSSYRPFKALTFGALHAVGMVHADPVQVGNVIYLKRYKERRSEN